MADEANDAPLPVLGGTRDGAPRRRPVRSILLGLIAAVVGLACAWGVTVFGLGLGYTVVPPVSTLMLGRWVTGQAANRDYVPLQEISPHLPLAVIASEDGRFCQHGGVDWAVIRQVVEEADEDGPARGASTIPMQAAKNLFLWPSRSYIRKGLELPLALYIDLVWSKRRMIEVYLNVAEWGEGTFGAEAAARRYFNKPARSLSRREAALLATALPNPLRRNPARPTARHRLLAERLIARMEASGPIDSCVASEPGRG